MTVEFMIQGKITSANRVTRNVALRRGEKFVARSLKSKSAREDTERIKSLATAARLTTGWKVPNLAKLSIFAYNSLLDVGNIEKVIGDSIKGGVLIVDDRPGHLESLFVRHMPKDHRGERYAVRVETIYEELPL